MTLAAGFPCSGGIILCADSEFTQGVLKTQGQKILTHRREGLSLAFTGAGDWDYVEMTFQKIVRKLQEQDDTLELSQLEAQDILEEILLEVYDKNISTVKEEVDFGWLAAIRTPDEEVGLFRSFRSCALVRSSGFQCTGMGEILAKYLSDILYAPNMSLNQGVFLAAYILRLTKRYVTTVGGRSDILALTPDGEMKYQRPDFVKDLETMFEDFDSILRPLLFSCPDIHLPDPDFAARLQNFTTQIGELHEKLQNSQILDFLDEL